MPGSAAEFDYVVVGAGSSGCVLANRLSADGSTRVAVIEAGPRDSSFWIHLPIGYGRTMWDPAVNWKFHTEPEPNMAGRRIYWPRGRVLGGSSSINGLIVIRGQHEDYDRWARNGASGWSWDEVQPYFIKIESNADLAGDQLHGNSGPLAVASIGHRHELIEAFIAAGEANGVPRTADFNGRTQEGAGYFQLTTRKGWRVSAADAYLRPAEKRANVSVFTDTQASRILFDDRQAVGVMCRSGTQTRALKARRGVILSAGAIQSPQLLMLSGIGPGKHLRDRGVPVLIDRPAVGQNLQDHLQFRLIFKCTKAITTNDALRSLWGRAMLGLEWLLFRTGALAVGINQGGMFTRLMPDATSPDIQFHVSTLSADMAGGKVHDFSGFTMSVCELRPESRGHIALASADPMTPPAIHANYLATPTDRDYAVASIRFARKLAATSPLAELVEAEVTPGPEVNSDTEILDFARRSGATIFHPSGTCRMGADDDAVVDPRLRVRGVSGLWVVDCSIMPTLVSGNTNVPAMMIAEKAADMILEDNQQQLGRTPWADSGLSDRDLRRVVTASLIGATVEWYDFFLYGTVAGIVFNKLYFPVKDPLISILLAYTTFAVGFLARPLGGVIFGHFGDRIGRKSMLVLTLMIMGIATVLIGLLPTYQQIGIAAPILLLVLRVLQGIGLGGEWGGAVSMTYEYAPEGKRGLYASFPQIGLSIGLCLSAGIVALASSLPEAQFLAWGWRVGFLISVVLVAVGLYIRLKIMETPEFTRLKALRQEVPIPFMTMLRDYPRNILLGMGARYIDGVFFNVFAVFSIAYLVNTVHINRTTALLGVFASALVMIVFIPLFGHLSDKWGRGKTYAIGSLLLAISVFPAFWLMSGGNIVAIYAGMIVPFGIIYAMCYGPEAGLFCDLFDARVRYTGISFVYQFSGIFASGITPIIATYLIAENGNQPWYLCAYVVFAALVSAACSAAIKGTASYRPGMAADIKRPATT